MMMTILFTAGWALAAFLAGLLCGRHFAGPREPPAAKPASPPAPAATAEETRRAAREWRELQNFLNYDGTAQAADD